MSYVYELIHEVCTLAVGTIASSIPFPEKCRLIKMLLQLWGEKTATASAFFFFFFFLISSKYWTMPVNVSPTLARPRFFCFFLKVYCNRNVMSRYQGLSYIIASYILVNIVLYCQLANYWDTNLVLLASRSPVNQLPWVFLSYL